MMSEPFLIFSLGAQRYALSIHEVVEVAAMVELASVPGMQPPMLGVANRHGSVLPVIDLRPAATQINPSMVFIVGVSGSQHVGLVVDDVHHVEYLEETSPSRLGEAYVRAIIPHQGELIQVITLPPLLAKVLPGLAPEQGV